MRPVVGYDTGLDILVPFKSLELCDMYDIDLRIDAQDLSPTDAVADGFPWRWGIVNDLAVPNVNAVVVIKATFNPEVVARFKGQFDRFFRHSFAHH